MDGLSTASGFQLQFQNFMYYAGPIMQVVFWVVLSVAAVWACLIFKRYVDFMTGAIAEEPTRPAAEKPVSVEEFVD